MTGIEATDARCIDDGHPFEKRAVDSDDDSVHPPLVVGVTVNSHPILDLVNGNVPDLSRFVYADSSSGSRCLVEHNAASGSGIEADRAEARSTEQGVDEGALAPTGFTDHDNAGDFRPPSFDSLLQVRG